MLQPQDLKSVGVVAAVTGCLNSLNWVMKTSGDEHCFLSSTTDQASDIITPAATPSEKRPGSPIKMIQNAVTTGLDRNAFGTTLMTRSSNEGVMPTARMKKATAKNTSGSIDIMSSGI